MNKTPGADPQVAGGKAMEDHPELVAVEDWSGVRESPNT